MFPSPQDIKRELDKRKTDFEPALKWFGSRITWKNFPKDWDKTSPVGISIEFIENNLKQDNFYHKTCLDVDKVFRGLTDLGFEDHLRQRLQQAGWVLDDFKRQIYRQNNRRVGFTITITPKEN